MLKLALSGLEFYALHVIKAVALAHLNSRSK